MDIYGDLFEDAKFNRHQVGLLEASFKSVRNALEKPIKNKSDVIINPSQFKPLQVAANA